MDWKAACAGQTLLVLGAAKPQLVGACVGDAKDPQHASHKCASSAYQGRLMGRLVACSQYTTLLPCNLDY